MKAPISVVRCAFGNDLWFMFVHCLLNLVWQKQSKALINNKDWQTLLSHCDLQLEILLLCLKVQSCAFAQLTVTSGHLQQWWCWQFVRLCCTYYEMELEVKTFWLDSIAASLFVLNWLGWQIVRRLRQPPQEGVQDLWGASAHWKLEVADVFWWISPPVYM